MRPAFLTIDLSAIRDNVAAIQRTVGDETAVAAIVKANAYGHGAVEVARAATEAGARLLCVAIVDEGLQLREAGLQEPILVLGPPNEEEAEVALAHDLMATVSDPCHASIVSRAARRFGRAARIHIKLDTGMGRHGARPAVTPALARLVEGDEHLIVDGIFSHFADAYNDDLTWTLHQLSQFHAMAEHFTDDSDRGPTRHLCNSVSTLRVPDAHLDMVRPGSILYGFNPGFDPDLMPEGIRPVARLTCRIGTVKLIGAGEPVGYGCTWRAPRESRIAVLPVGYADGVPRALSNKAEVLIGGRRCPVVGRVSMDAITVDATDAGPVAVDDEAVLIGPQGDERITIEEIARRADTIGEEITSRLSRRLPRVYEAGSDD